ncbi:MAG: hypothetical protein ONB05_02815, partial [candidate division KSB1 bacterium]|nr:hypothetical protein [candidate division KSB1 bacterium]
LYIPGNPERLSDNYFDLNAGQLKEVIIDCSEVSWEALREKVLVIKGMNIPEQHIELYTT